MGGFRDKLREIDALLHKSLPELGGRLDSRIHARQVTLPVKWERNTRNEMALLRRYTHGDLKYENTGRTCGNCVNYYPDLAARTGGRCRAKGFIEVHEDWPADNTHNWTDPVSGYYFPEWPACPLFVLRERLSRK